MTDPMNQDTIAAIATPMGSGGIGIIRLSGPNSTAIAQELFRPVVRRTLSWDSRKCDNIPANRLNYGFICDPQSGAPIDEVLLAIMPGPRSYTREDVVEIQSHAGPAILGKLLALVLENGARLAEPGEFTRRAFLNGRIDLSQAEAVADMINARTDQGLKIAALQLSGEMKQTIQMFLKCIDAIFSELTAIVEFPEDVEDRLDRRQLSHEIRDQLLAPITELIELYQYGHVMRDGLRLDIVGCPNVGKSSLLNRLLKKEKAIVTPYPGTTRDLVEDFFTVSGIPFFITDTAGLHASQDPVEIIGIQKTQAHIVNSDIILFVVDGSQPFSSDDLDVFSQINSGRIILVINKIDLVNDLGQIHLPKQWARLTRVEVSALRGGGIDNLRNAIAQLCLSHVPFQPARMLIPTLRQKEALGTAQVALKRVEGLIGDGTSDELCLADLDSAKQALHRINGEQVERDILDDIFSRFCIGK